MKDDGMLRGSVMSLDKKMNRGFHEMSQRLLNIETKLGLLLSHADFERDFYEMELTPTNYTVTLTDAPVSEEREESP